MLSPMNPASRESSLCAGRIQALAVACMLCGSSWGVHPLVCCLVCCLVLFVRAALILLAHPSLEHLAAMEETVVREKAVESACTVIGLMQTQHPEVSLAPVTLPPPPSVLTIDSAHSALEGSGQRPAFVSVNDCHYWHSSL